MVKKLVKRSPTGNAYWPRFGNTKAMKRPTAMISEGMKNIFRMESPDRIPIKRQIRRSDCQICSMATPLFKQSARPMAKPKNPVSKVPVRVRLT